MAGQGSQIVTKTVSTLTSSIMYSQTYWCQDGSCFPISSREHHNTWPRNFSGDKLCRTYNYRQRYQGARVHKKPSRSKKLQFCFLCTQDDSRQVLSDLFFSNRHPAYCVPTESTTRKTLGMNGFASLSPGLKKKMYVFELNKLDSHQRTSSKQSITSIMIVIGINK